MRFSRTGVYPIASSFLSASSIATSLLDGEEGVTSPVMAPEGVWDTNGLFSEILDAICCAFYFSGLSMMVLGCVFVGSLWYDGEYIPLCVVSRTPTETIPALEMPPFRLQWSHLGTALPNLHRSRAVSAAIKSLGSGP
jgi:hypothetical protein